MNSTKVITRVAERHWHALDDDLVVGRGHAAQRPDGRMFVSIDSWHDAVFDQLAAAMLADLPTPLYTVVDEVELDLATDWRRAGFTIGRREWELLVPTDPQVTGLDSAPPRDVTIVSVGAAQEGPLSRNWTARFAPRSRRRSAGRRCRPRFCRARKGKPCCTRRGTRWRCRSDRYVGLVRVAPLTRQPRIGLIAVRADEQRRGIAGRCSADVLGALHRDGIATAMAEIHESNAAAMALFEGIGSRPRQQPGTGVALT